MTFPNVSFFAKSHVTTYFCIPDFIHFVHCTFFKNLYISECLKVNKLSS